MREIYTKRPQMIDIQQGVIFNGCVSDDYPDSEVFGIIITSRCDIANEKVTTIHYLPIVTLEEWLNYDYIKLYQNQERKTIYRRMTKLLLDNKISDSILSSSLSKNDILTAAGVLKEKQRNNFQSDYETYISLANFDYCKENVNNWKDGTKVIKDICEWKNMSFYLIEDWEDCKKYKIILLREIRRLKLSFALNLKRGIEEQKISDMELKYNDFMKKINSTNLYRTIAEVKSPYIEHIVQSFFHNFGRIGIENHTDNLNEQIFDNINKIIKK